MERKVKEINYNIEQLETLGVIPFTLEKYTLDKPVIAWSSNGKFYDSSVSSKERVEYFLSNVKKIGIDDIMMCEQPNAKEVCHEITYEELLDYYKSPLAHQEGTIWNIRKECEAIFMSRETHFLVMESTGRSVSLAFPAADCAIIRMYDKKKDVIGLAHSGFEHTTKNIIKSMAEYMRDHFNSDLNDVIVFASAFAQTGIIWNKYPPFAENNSTWDNYIVELNDKELEELKKVKKVSSDKKYYNVLFGNKIYDQLIDAGLSEDNIYFNKDNTIKNDSYFSNNRIKLFNDRNGRNLFGISFDSLPIYENKEKRLVKTILK